ncbi:hypothetical protein D3C77_640170 [compost metagenome]
MRRSPDKPGFAQHGTAGLTVRQCHDHGQIEPIAINQRAQIEVGANGYIQTYCGKLPGEPSQ